MPDGRDETAAASDPLANLTDEQWKAVWGAIVAAAFPNLLVIARQKSAGPLTPAQYDEAQATWLRALKPYASVLQTLTPEQQRAAWKTIAGGWRNPYKRALNGLQWDQSPPYEETVEGTALGRPFQDLKIKIIGRVIGTGTQPAVEFGWYRWAPVSTSGLAVSELRIASKRDPYELVATWQPLTVGAPQAISLHGIADGPDVGRVGQFLKRALGLLRKMQHRGRHALEDDSYSGFPETVVKAMAYKQKYPRVPWDRIAKSYLNIEPATLRKHRGRYKKLYGDGTARSGEGIGE